MDVLKRSSRLAAGWLRHEAPPLVIGTLLVSIGMAFYSKAKLLTGGVAGMAFLLHYGADLALGPALMLVNLPFYWLALRQLGWGFTVKTAVAVTLLALVTELAPRMLTIASMSPAYAAVMGGLVIGCGFVILFRGNASLGGVSVLALYLERRLGWRTGHVQMGCDCLIVAAALLLMDPVRVGWSVVGVLVLNLVVTLQFRLSRAES